MSMLQNVGVNIICQTLQENMRSNEQFPNDTTPHIDDKATVVFTFNCSMCIITVA
jgi:hypothetical protein